MTHTDDPINELWAWVLQQPNGVEKIANPWVSHGYYPLITSSQELAKIRMLGLAKDAERETGCPVKLVKFVRAEDAV